MSRTIAANSNLSRRNAELLLDGHAFVTSVQLIPNSFISIRWSETAFASCPFRGLQEVLERLRKLDSLEPYIIFWVRERERFDAIEHAHILFLCRSIKICALEDMLCNWVGSERGSGGVDIRPCKKIDNCNYGTLLTGYFLKGLPMELQPMYLTSAQRRGWSKSQGVVVGKRAGVSQYVSRGIQSLRAARLEWRRRANL
jgi:hypothetical protein